MLTIRTRFYGPTNTRGSRIVATADPNNVTGRATVAYDHSLDAIGNHRAAAVALMARLGRTGELRAASWMGDYYWSEDPQDVRYNATTTIEIVARTWRPNADTRGGSHDWGEWGPWDVAYTGNIENEFHSEQDALLAILALRAQGGDWNTDIEYGLQVAGAARPYSEGL